MDLAGAHRELVRGVVRRWLVDGPVTVTGRHLEHQVHARAAASALFRYAEKRWTPEKDRTVLWRTAIELMVEDGAQVNPRNGTLRGVVVRGG
jgi:hypothetical protein